MPQSALVAVRLSQLHMVPPYPILVGCGDGTWAVWFHTGPYPNGKQQHSYAPRPCRLR